MDSAKARKILEKVRSGELAVEEALDGFRMEPVQSLGFATIDTHRGIRNGFPEVVFGQGKTREHLLGICQSILERRERLLVTRVAADVADFVREVLPQLDYHPVARCLTHDMPVESESDYPGFVGIVTAGTSDIPVAEEASLTLRMMGHRTELRHDLGVAGIHRILGAHQWLLKAHVLIVVAGMEAALPSVVAGLTEKPLIGVPTSVGYGTHFGGITSLLGMLNSCGSGVTVVNIDNGFGAGYAAAQIHRLTKVSPHE